MIRPIVRMALAMACISSVLAQAQSYYTDEWCVVDDLTGQFDCTPYTEVIGDPGISGCNRQATLSSTLNGQYASASTTYPTTAMVTQSISNATPGVDYPWTFTYTFYYDNPYGKGGCVASAISWPETLGVALSTYAWASNDPDGSGDAEYNLACPNGNSAATCGADHLHGNESFKWAEEFMMRGTDKNGVRWCAGAGPIIYLNGWPAPMPCR